MYRWYVAESDDSEGATWLPADRSHPIAARQTHDYIVNYYVLHPLINQSVFASQTLSNRYQTASEFGGLGDFRFVYYASSRST